ncbi:MBL fold metallo-hydrolase [Halomarina oriensis]|uniref:MBL fold metallo-hydrolase n=1 Tax=Halomarina oriensis TaxID=671145 RepID=A0A6B0GRK4_9EURY|nr:MBL fold metallo-hydrolase [Halomarina oriensis]MWG36761.1 MBL fold metallo-hydrolase [Halomarina oriensis]
MERVRDDTVRLQLGWTEPLVVNAYVFDDGDGVTLVDTGMPVNRRSLRSELAAAGYRPTDVERVLLTHYDLDHVGGLTPLARLLGGPLFDAEVYLGAEDVALARGERDPPWLHHKGSFHRVAREVFDLDDVTLTPVDEGDRIGGFTAYHTPGHNPGHTAYVHDDGVAFVGDLLWETDGELTPPFWGDSYSMRELRASVRAFEGRAGAFEALCPGHGVPFVRGGSDRLRSLASRLG